MGIPARAPRPPAAGGGRVLLLLGVFLALAAGAIAIVVVTQYSPGGGGQMVTVVVANQNLPTGTQLSASGSNGAMAISAAFGEESVNANFKPADAYVFTSEAALESSYSGFQVVSPFFKGDILRTGDQRLTMSGGPAGSLTNANPNPTVFPTSDVIVQLTLGTKVAVVAGDRIDILVTECNLPGSHNPNGCVTQTTLTDVYVYSVDTNTIYLVLGRQNALDLQFLSETGTLELAIRNPNDKTTTPTTTPVDATTIVSQFSF